MTARNIQPNAETEAFFQLLEDHQHEVRRVLTLASNTPWSLGEYADAIAGLADAETELALRIGRQLLRSVSIEKLQSILLHVGAFDAADSTPGSPPTPIADVTSFSDEVRSQGTTEHDIRGYVADHRDSGDPIPNQQSRSGIRTVHTTPIQATPATLELESPVDSTGDETDAFAPEAPSDSLDSRPAILTAEQISARLDEVQARLRGELEDNTVADVPTADMRARYRELRRTVNRSGLPSTAPQGISGITLERDQLRRMFSSDLMAELEKVPMTVNFAFTGWLITRIKMLQEVISYDATWDSTNGESRIWFHELVDHSRRTQPGSIEAFKGDSSPETNSWFDDAQAWEKRILSHINGDEETGPPKPNQTDMIRCLINEGRRIRPHESKIRGLLKDYLDAGFDPGHTRFLNAALAVSQVLDKDSRAPVDRVLLRALEKRQRELDQEELKAPKATLPEDWRGLSLTRGKRILMLGGKPKREQEVRLGEAFQCESFEWMEITKGNRNADGAIEKIKNGTFDVVIVQLQFIAHAVSRPVFAERSETTRIIGAWTYGLTGLAHTFETHLPGA